MVSLQSTSFQSGGFVVSTEDPAIIAAIHRILLLIEDLGLELLATLLVVQSAAGSLDTLCRRVIGWLDWIEFLLATPGKTVRRMAEDWTLFWFRVGWHI